MAHARNCGLFIPPRIDISQAMSPDSVTKKIYNGRFVPVGYILDHLRNTLDIETVIEPCHEGDRCVETHFIDGVVVTFESRPSHPHHDSPAALYAIMTCHAQGREEKISRIEQLINGYLASVPVAR